MGSTHLTAPPPRDLGQEASNTLRTQIELAPQQYAAYAQFAPQYAQTDVGILGQSLFGPGWSGNLTDINRGLTQESTAQTTQANRDLRFENLRDVDQMGGWALQQQYNLNTPLYENMDALDARARAGTSLSGNPALNELNNRFAAGPQFQSVSAPMVNAPSIGSPANVGFERIAGPQEARDVAAERVNALRDFERAQVAQGDYGLATAASRLGQVGPGQIQQTLEGQALNDLALGRGLSPEQERNAQQQARAAYAARGLGDSNAAIAAEVLNLDAAATAREAQRRQFAQGVDAAGFGQRQAGLQSALGVSDASRGYAGLGLEAQRTNIGAQMQGNQLDLQGQMSNQDAALRAALANQQRDLSMNQQRYQSALANQQAGITTGLANQQMGYNASLANAQLGMQGQLANQQAGMQGQLANQATAQQAQAQNLQLGQYLAGLGIQTNQQDFNNLLAASQQRSATMFNPFSTVLGQNTINQGTNAGMYGMAQPAVGNAFSQTSNFNPFNPYAQDLYNTNYNAEAATRIGRSNNAAALWGAGFGAIGQAAGAAIGAYAGSGCWVARECFGETSPKWILFRHWLFTQGSDRRVGRYLRYGPKIAAWLSRRPDWKARVRVWMETKIATNVALQAA